MITTISIPLPLPDKSLSPNARVHWAKKHRASRAAKDMAYYTALSCGAGKLLWEKATLVADFYFKVNRTRDEDNLSAMLKAYIDGISKTGMLVNDSGLKAPLINIHVDPQHSEQVVLNFTKLH